jgi:hypothetical protein
LKWVLHRKTHLIGHFARLSWILHRWTPSLLLVGNLSRRAYFGNAQKKLSTADNL